MTSKPRKTTTNSLKKSLNDMRLCLNQSVPGFKEKSLYGLKFSRIGTRYRIEDAPISPSDVIGLKLEKSFNDFMKKLKVNYSNIQVKGECVIGTQANTFLIGYEDYEKKGKKVVKKTYGIDGIV